MRIMLIIDGTKASHGERSLVLEASGSVGVFRMREAIYAGNEVVDVASK